MPDIAICRRARTMWPRLALILVVGYHCFTREFAYIGIQPAHIFLGEIVLTAALLFRPELLLRWSLGSLVRPSPLSTAAALIAALAAYGVWQIARGLLSGYEPQDVLETAVFAVYPAYFFIGVWAGVERPELLDQTLRVLAWTAGLYGLAWVAILAPPPNVYESETDAGLFGFTQPSACGLAILALLCLPRRGSWSFVPLWSNILCVLALQMRAEWLATIAGVGLWSVLRRKLGAAFGVAGGCILLLGALQVLHIELPGRTGSVSLTETTARLVAPFSASLAQSLSPENAVGHIGTAEFRSEWWSKIWQAANTNPERFLFGGGFGYPLRSLVYDADPRVVLRSPHGVFFFALGYLGWIGVSLFFGMQAAIGWLCWQVFRRTQTPVAVVYWLASVVIGLMSNTFETPFGAIPFYLVCGMAMSPLASPLWHAVRARQAVFGIVSPDPAMSSSNGAGSR